MADYYWALHPDDYTSGQWHLVKGPKLLITRTTSVCGLTFMRRGWVKGDGSGWKWIRDTRAMVCMDCVDHLPESFRPKGLRDLLELKK